MKRFACSMMLASAACAGGLQAQTRARLPVIAGNDLVHMLVARDGSVKTWGDPHRMATSPSLDDGSKPGAEVREPRLLADVRDVVDAAAGDTPILLLKRDGTVLA